MRPLQILDVHRRGKITLIFAWVGATLCSFPQILVFHLEVRPGYTYVTQCTTFNTYPSHVYELLYFLFAITAVFWFPLCMIFYTYIRIFVEISRRSKEDTIRRSSIDFLSRARVRTLKMTITIIVVFIICWTPHSVLSFWYCIDQSSFRKIDQRILKALFLFTCTNPCMNPIIYGIFNRQERNKTNLQSSRPLMSINATVELLVAAYARDFILTVFLIALPALFNSPTSFNRRSIRRSEQPPSKPESRRCPSRSDFSIDDEPDIRQIERMHLDERASMQMTRHLVYASFSRT
ncbi:gonadotropin-releasing hormone II receptor-like [Odontomachus brunneus]|uniref:gonadotropin-releasing hormone II receptor-like n=1 Tax=Odontomachus brunneus TaxID=486640 RepID=UPI0013F1E250|nr:gonadotropin-releasing hormone II receptor-like [Odontomachus brunneus]